MRAPRDESADAVLYSSIFLAAADRVTLRDASAGKLAKTDTHCTRTT
jgi:hypothetical protein